MADRNSVAYHGPLRLTLVTDGKYAGLWRVDGPFAMTWRGRRVEVPDRFVTDGPSIPRLFRSVIPVRGRQWEASLVHDHLYWNRPKGWSRRLVDRVFLEGLRASGVHPVRAYLMWVGVRIGGHFLWGKRKD